VGRPQSRRQDIGVSRQIHPETEVVLRETWGSREGVSPFWTLEGTNCLSEGESEGSALCKRRGKEARDSGKNILRNMRFSGLRKKNYLVGKKIKAASLNRGK